MRVTVAVELSSFDVVAERRERWLEETAEEEEEEKEEEEEAGAPEERRSRERESTTVFRDLTVSFSSFVEASSLRGWLAVPSGVVGGGHSWGGRERQRG